MAHRRSQLVLGLALLALFSAFSPAGAEPPAAPPASSPPQRRALLRRQDSTPSPELENIRKALEALTPEQRQQFRENFNRWASLAPEEKRALREREELRRQHMTEEIEAALKQLGIELDPARRQAFMRRYTEERRKVEEQLRKETEAKRAPMVADLISRLKAEFSSPASPPK
jgi:hypothetical protein